MKTSQKKTMDLVNRAASTLATVDNVSSSRCFYTLVALCAAEEKEHRGWGCDFAKYHPFAPSVANVAKFFAVHRIGQYLAGDRMPEVKDFLHLQKSAFHAAAVVSKYETYLRTRLAAIGVDPAALAALDYSAFISPEEVAA